MNRLSGIIGTMNLIQEQALMGCGSFQPLTRGRELSHLLYKSDHETISSTLSMNVSPRLQRRYSSLLTYPDSRFSHLKRINHNNGKEEPFFGKRGLLFFGLGALATSILFGSRREAFANERETNEEIKEIFNAKGEILNVSKLSLTNSNLQEILKLLSNENNAFMRVVWGAKESLDHQLIKQIEYVVAERRKTFEERPSLYTCAKFCKLAYKSKKKLQKGKNLPKDWNVLALADSVQRDGYFGVAFVNDKTKQIILAHRGTDALFRDLLTDAIGVIGGIVEEQQKSAIGFTHKILKKSDKRGYRLGIVGHSLGGWLAQLTAALAASKGYEGIYVVTLDTPGAREMIQTYFEGDRIVSMTRVDEKRLDFTHFLSLPNVVNCCNTQVGDLFHIVPSLDQSLKGRVMWCALKTINIIFHTLFGVEANVAVAVEYALRTHSSEAQLKALKNHSSEIKLDDFSSKNDVPKPLYKVLSWPSLGKMGTHYSNFFEIMRKNMRAHPKKLPFIDHLPEADRFLVTYVARYRFIEAPLDEISLCHFSDEVINWLTVLKEKGANDLEKIEKILDLKPGELQELVSFEITKEKITVSKPLEFKKTVELLLKVHPELLFLVRDPAFSLSLEALSLIRANLRKELIHACETIVPVKLYLYDPATKKEINEHKKEKARLTHEITKRDELRAILLSIESPVASDWIKIAKKQQKQLKIMEKISEALIDYKSREFTKARESAINALDLIENYKSTLKSLGLLPFRLRASLYSLLAKIDRSTWINEESLKNCEANYHKALDPVTGLPEEASLWSNYGALLNNWGEWLFWEGRIDEAFEKHLQAIDAHKKSFELSCLGDWLFTDFDQAWIKRDYARGIYLLAKANRDSNKITEKEFQKKLSEILLFFPDQKESTNPILATTELFHRIILKEFQKKLSEILLFFPDQKESTDPILATTELFHGIILQDMRRIDEALECYNRGLTKAPNHPTLLYRQGTVLFALGNKEGAIKAARASKEAFLRRGVNTPEDRYRLGLTQQLLEKILPYSSN